MENFAGYIIKKTTATNSSERKALLDETNTSWTWVNQISEGGLIKPSKEFLEEIVKLERIFEKYKKNSFGCKGILKKCLELSNSIKVDTNIKSLFFRSRIYFYVKEKNSIIKREKSEKIIYNKKLKKIIT